MILTFQLEPLSQVLMIFNTEWFDWYICILVHWNQWSLSLLSSRDDLALILVITYKKWFLCAIRRILINLNLMPWSEILICKALSSQIILKLSVLLSVRSKIFARVIWYFRSTLRVPTVHVVSWNWRRRINVILMSLWRWIIIHIVAFLRTWWVWSIWIRSIQFTTFSLIFEASWRISSLHLWSHHACTFILIDRVCSNIGSLRFIPAHLWSICYLNKWLVLSLLDWLIYWDLLAIDWFRWISIAQLGCIVLIVLEITC